MTVAQVGAGHFGSGGRQTLSVLVEHDVSIGLNEL